MTSTYRQDNDKLYRYLFQNRAVRGEWVRLNNTFTETLNTHHYPKPVQDLLGEMLVATSLLTATMKFEGTITVQIQGDGAMKLAAVNGNHQQQLRAVARVESEIAENATLTDMVGNGVLIISIIPEEGERYQGVISLDKPTISQCLEDYFARSEQLQTQLTIHVGEFNGAAVAAGLLLQIMPDGVGTREDFDHLAILTASIKPEELFGLSAEDALFRLYHEEQVELYPAQDTAFKCGCSRERSGAAIMLLPESEVADMLAEKNGVIDIRCECCGTQYFFNQYALEELKREAQP